LGPDEIAAGKVNLRSIATHEERNNQFARSILIAGICDLLLRSCHGLIL